MNAQIRTLTWVVGAGGLLGRAVVSAYAACDADELWSLTEAIDWEHDNLASEQLAAAVTRFLDVAAVRALSWRVFWCAGAGVVATDPERLERETRLFRAFTMAMGRTIASSEVHRQMSGAVFLASSAGAVYGGSSARPPYDELSPTGTRSAYGEQKLAQETLINECGEVNGLRVLIGRLSNLYGPNQNAAKPQGLVTHVGRAALKREPLQLYMPLDTIRDYILANDAARLIRRSMDRLEAMGSASTVIRIMASEAETSVASILAAWKSVLKRPPGVVMASSPVGRLQPPTLSFRSCVWPDLRIQPTPLPIGVHAVYAAQLEELRMGRL